jgi:arylsulfatase A-like enzyme
MGRKILFVTTDQQRYDTLGCNGGGLSRTPVIDGLAAEGIRYERAVPQSVVCMPSRSTIVTGQHPSTHGVWMNGVALPVDAPSVAATSSPSSTRSAASSRTAWPVTVCPP